MLREKSTSREQWIAKRGRGIGASEAAAVVGLSPWTTTMELWKLKTGRSQPKDLSDNGFVDRGVRLEPALRNLFKAQYPQMKVVHHPFDMLSQKERPWLYATLDGEIIDMEHKNRKGILEIKTCSPVGAKGWAEWDSRIPHYYYIQILHQFLATGFDFAKLYAMLEGKDGDFQVRTYTFEAGDCAADMEWLLEKETAFWDKAQKNEIPGLTIRL